MLNRQLRLLAIFQVVGGMLLVVGAIRDPSLPASSTWFRLLLVPALFGAFAAIAGVLLLLQEPIGLRLSLLAQLLQLVQVGAPVRYIYVTGPKTWLVLSNLGFLLQLGGGGDFAMSAQAPDGTLAGVGFGGSVTLGWMGAPIAGAQWSVGFNALAAFYIIVLRRYLPRSPSTNTAPDPSCR